MNTVVSFELAKLLKEKGFDKTVNNAYLFNSERANVPNGEFSNKGEKYISAPTIAEVVMWLYEKHLIWISVDISGAFAKNTLEGELYYKIIKNNREVQPGFLMQDFYNSPTEAYEAAIMFCLKQII